MSTGIGNHDYSRWSGSGGYQVGIAICPYCSYPGCEADHVDVGIGLVQCGPYYCTECGASEISYLDNRILSEQEKKTGWYEPESPVSEIANTYKGKLVNHEVAKALYNVGMLDD